MYATYPRNPHLRITCAKVFFLSNKHWTDSITLTEPTEMHEGKNILKLKKNTKLQNQNHECFMEWLKLQHNLHHLNSARLGTLETDYGVECLQ